MEYLYVCHFSNGHIKVGRSIDPRARIAAHADRVACVGIELIEHHIASCAGYSAPAETELIRKCAEIATARHKNEWFSGVDFLDACGLANDAASVTHTSPWVGVREDLAILEIAITTEGGVGKLAESLAVKQNVISNWRADNRGIPKPWGMVLEMKYAEQIAAYKAAHPESREVA